MKRIITFFAAAFMLFSLPQALHAQWKVGVNAGATYNLYSLDKQFMTDYRYDGVWGLTLGVASQYSFTEWLGLKAGLNIAQRNYRHTRNAYADRLDCLYRNDYLLLPFTADFSFGGRSLRGFLDLGVYGGYWLSGHRSGKEYTSFGETPQTFSEDIVFLAEKDQRWDFGYAGGIGLEWRFAPHWAVQAEALGYYSVVSSVKQYMAQVKDYRYNTTPGLQAGVYYIF